MTQPTSWAQAVQMWQINFAPPNDAELPEFYEAVSAVSAFKAFQVHHKLSRRRAQQLCQSVHLADVSWMLEICSPSRWYDRDCPVGDWEFLEYTWDSVESFQNWALEGFNSEARAQWPGFFVIHRLLGEVFCAATTRNCVATKDAFLALDEGFQQYPPPST